MALLCISQNRVRVQLYSEQLLLYEQPNAVGHPVQNEWGSVPESKELLGITPKWHDFKTKIDNWYNNVK